jgi:hypothetical protein
MEPLVLHRNIGVTRFPCPWRVGDIKFRQINISNIDLRWSHFLWQREDVCKNLTTRLWRFNSYIVSETFCMYAYIYSVLSFNMLPKSRLLVCRQLLHVIVEDNDYWCCIFCMDTDVWQEIISWSTHEITLYGLRYTVVAVLYTFLVLWRDG